MSFPNQSQFPYQSSISTSITCSNTILSLTPKDYHFIFKITLNNICFPKYIFNLGTKPLLHNTTTEK